MSQYKGKIYLKAYPEVNLGDDLFIKIILERYPEILFCLEADESYKDIFKDNGNLSIITNKTAFFKRVLNFFTRRFFPALYKAQLIHSLNKTTKPYLLESDAFVCIGGSMFIQNNFSIDNSFVFYNNAKNILGNKPMFFLGANFGPYKDDEYRLRYDNLFKQSYDVCFRETYSYNLFSHLPQVRIHPDIVFGYKADSQIKTIPKSVGFSIVPAYKASIKIDEPSYIDKYTTVIQQFISLGYSIKLFSFCKEEGDEAIIEIICSKLSDSSNVQKIYYNGDINDFMDKYRSVESVFCGRFHALILSMVFNQKIMPVAYSMKMVNILKDIGYKGDIIEIKDFSTYDFSAIETKLNNLYDVCAYKTEASLHFQKLDELINSIKTDHPFKQTLKN